MQIRTKILTLRPYELSDASKVAESVMHTLPQLMEWLPWAKGYTETDPLEKARESIEMFNGQTERGEKYPLAVFLNDGPFIGSSGFWPHDEPGVFEIGYWLDTRFTGKGLMTHAVEAQTRYLFEKRGARLVEVRCHASNSSSMKVALNAGFKMNREEVRDNIHINGEVAITKVFVHTPESWDVHDHLA